MSERVGTGNSVVDILRREAREYLRVERQSRETILRLDGEKAVAQHQLAEAIEARESIENAIEKLVTNP